MNYKQILVGFFSLVILAGFVSADGLIQFNNPSSLSTSSSGVVLSSPAGNLSCSFEINGIPNSSIFFPSISSATGGFDFNATAKDYLTDWNSLTNASIICSTPAPIKVIGYDSFGVGTSDNVFGYVVNETDLIATLSEQGLSVSSEAYAKGALNYFEVDANGLSNFAPSAGLGSKIKSVSACAVGCDYNLSIAFGDPTIVFPSGIIAADNLTVYNENLSYATNVNFTEYVQINATNFTGYMNTNLSNVEFFNLTGSILPSWLEYGTNSSQNASWWVQIPQGIAANSNYSLYAGFASNATSFYNQSGQTGEAPNLSATYGVNDNGQNVFAYYTNFSGTSAPTNWNTTLAQNGSTAAYNNGLLLTSTSANYKVQVQYQGAGFNPVNNTFEFWGNFTTQGFNMVGGSTSGAGIDATGSISIMTDTGQTNYQVRAGAGTEIPFPQAIATNMFLMSIWENSTTAIGSLNYGGTNSTASGFTPESTLYIGVESSQRTTVNTSQLYVQYARVRILPPNGIMPTIFGNGIIQNLQPNYTVVNLIYPANGSVLVANPSGSVNFTFIPTDSVGILNATFYDNWNGGWSVNTTNQSNVVNNTNNYFNLTNVPLGTWVWNVRLCDINANCSFSVNNFTFSNAYTWNLSVFNEGNNTAIINWTANFSNSTTSTVFNISQNPINTTLIPVGNDSINVTATDASGYGWYVFYSNNTQLTNSANLSVGLWPNLVIDLGNFNTGSISGSRGTAGINLFNANDPYQVYLNNILPTYQCSPNIQGYSPVDAKCTFLVGNNTPPKLFLLQSFGITTDNSLNPIAAGGISSTEETINTSNGQQYWLIPQNYKPLNVSAYDFVSGALIGNIGVTMSGANSLSCLNHQDPFIFNFTNSNPCGSGPTGQFNTPGFGNTTIAVADSNGAYSPLNFPSYFIDNYSNVNNSFAQSNLVFYMLNKTQGQFVIFSVQTGSNVGIPNVTVQVYAVVAGTTQLIVTSLTDSSGTASFFMSPTTSYTLVFSATGYQTLTEIIVPAYTQYTVRLVPTPVPVPSGVFQNVTYTWFPSFNIINSANQTASVEFSVNDSASQLYDFGFTVYFNNTVLCNTTNVTNSPMGGSVGCSFNATALSQEASTNNQIYAVGFIGETNYSEAIITNTWQLGNTPYNTLSLQGALDSTANIPGAQLFLLIIGLIAMAWVGTEFQGLAGSVASVAVAALIIMGGVFSSPTSGGINWIFYAFIVLVELALLYLRGVFG